MIRKIVLPFMVAQDESTKIDIENFSPLQMLDNGFDLPVKGEVILDAKGKKLGKVLGH